MSLSSVRAQPTSRTRRQRPLRGIAGVVSVALLLAAATSLTTVGSVSAAPSSATAQQVTFHGLGVRVPGSWRIVSFSADPHACLRLDRATIYLGHAGDQSECPAHLIGGAPTLHIEALTPTSQQVVGTATVTIPAGGRVTAAQLPATGPVAVAMVAAGVVVTATYGSADAALMRHILTNSSVLPGAKIGQTASLTQEQALPTTKVNVPGTYLGKGFDACAAPSQSAMTAWRNGSVYESVGIYIGGVNRGCSQTNLTPTWVANEVAAGWHLSPTYVGLQAPCTAFHSRMSYTPHTAWAQGKAEAADAVAKARALGIVAPSTIYNDMEGYNSSNPSCVAAVMSYLSGWTYVLHTQAYESGVYSSASSGIHDLSQHYTSPNLTMPDDIWIAWWNGRADIGGGSYVPDGQWAYDQRIHQYAGNDGESHGGYTLQIDRNYVDVSAAVRPPRGCPTNLDYSAYPLVHWPAKSALVVTLQCMLARAGFDPGPATGVFNWRTAAAVRGLKSWVGLTGGDSMVGRWAWTALASAGPTHFLQLGFHGPRVRKVQRALTARLQRTVPINGAYDTTTRNAVMTYQRWIGLPPTGTVGQPTWHALHAGH